MRSGPTVFKAANSDHLFHRVIRKKWHTISHGEGVYLFDSGGNRYLDACGGVHVVSIGHAVPEVVAAMHEQAGRVSFTYNQFLSQSQIDLAAKIAAMTPDDLSRVFFVSGGSEATESAVKIARKYHLETGNPQKTKVIARWQSWHGNTLGALSLSGRESWRADYEPYLLDLPHIPSPYCFRCPLGKTYPDCGVACAEELEAVVRREGAENIAAFIAEPIVGTSATGLTPPQEYYPIIREICDRHNILMIVDEVVTGFGRTGRNFGIDHWGVVPDIVATGKGLSSGYSPIAATVVREEIYEAIHASGAGFVHGHTYGGNPLSCATALAVLNYIEEHDLIARCAAMGTLLLEELRVLEDLPIVGEVRGKGLLIGIELVEDKETRMPFDPAKRVTARIVERAFGKGVLVMPGAPGLIDGTRGDHIAISPPFTIDAEQIRRIVTVLDEAIREIERELKG